MVSLLHTHGRFSLSDLARVLIFRYQKCLVEGQTDFKIFKIFILMTSHLRAASTVLVSIPSLYWSAPPYFLRVWQATGRSSWSIRYLSSFLQELFENHAEKFCTICKFLQVYRVLVLVTQFSSIFDTRSFFDENSGEIYKTAYSIQQPPF